MNLTVGSAVLLSELITCLKDRHTSTWEKIKAELCATDAEFDRAFDEVIGRKRDPHKSLMWLPKKEGA